jgi:hypothetical protein
MSATPLARTDPGEAAGMTKINIATQLNKVFTAAVRHYRSDGRAAVDPRRYGWAGRDAVAPEVTRLLDLLGAGSIVQEETAGPRDHAVGRDAMAGGAGEPLSPVE